LVTLPLTYTSLRALLSGPPSSRNIVGGTNGSKSTAKFAMATEEDELGAFAVGDGVFHGTVVGRGGVSLEVVRAFITVVSLRQRNVFSVTSACNSRAAKASFIITLFTVH
jgi:hypothetical protein